MKILWLAKHPPQDVFLKALRDKFGNVAVIRDVSLSQSLEEIVRRARAKDHDETVLVGTFPMSFLVQIAECGVRPLIADLRPVPHKDQSHIEENGKFFRFVRFRRLTGVSLDFEEV
ncbi:MAG: hypothetical protein UY99_C0002G0011 [Parcubacteria group bacterium GW2011_GWA1_59_11]|nr:MAG: hypothetical protein UY99_C0002G0011 [Parcubacteria group bacterium GW2011_GWA1_59_11]